MWKTCWFYCFAFWDRLAIGGHYQCCPFITWEDSSFLGGHVTWRMRFPMSMELTERYDHTESRHGAQQWLPRVTAQVTGSEVGGQGPGLSTEGEHGTASRPQRWGQHSSVQPLLPQCWATAGEENYTMFVIVSVTWECVIYHAGKSFLAYLKSVSQAFSKWLWQIISAFSFPTFLIDCF